MADAHVCGAAAEKPPDNHVVKDGMLVSLDYTVKTPDGKLLETSKGSQPLQYIHGKKMMIPGLERELTGMKIGAEKHITVKPEDAVLVGTDKNGSPMPMTVKEIKEKTVVMDLNHPLAGKTLVFDVKVVDIQPPPTTPPTASKPAQPAQPSAPPKSAAPPQTK